MIHTLPTDCIYEVRREHRNKKAVIKIYVHSLLYQPKAT